MAFFRDMSDRMWHYISPRKTKERRDKPFKVPTVPAKLKTSSKGAFDMTPQTKITRWDVRTPGTTTSVDETLLPPSPPSSIPRSLEQQDELEGDTLLFDTVEQSPTGTSSSPEWDANEETIVVDDGKYMDESKAIDREKEDVRREVQGRELREAGWSQDAVFLFQKLGMRGFEPLMPDLWVRDFDSLPLDMFTSNENRAFIRSDSEYHFRAQHALAELFALGGYARDAILTRAPVRTPEYHIRKAVQKYHHWAMKDGGLKHVGNGLSLFDIVTTNKSTHSSVAEQKMVRKLGRLQSRWSDAFALHNRDNSTKSDYVATPEDLPTLYGVIASYTIMAFVSYVTPTELNGGKASLRIIAIFDFSKEGYDVWNSLAIAIFIIHCRNRMKQLTESLPEPEIVRLNDPDL